MKTFIVILILLTITYLIFTKLRNRSKLSTKNRQPYRLIEEGDRTIEEIMFSKPSNEVLAELSSKNLEDLTGNEILVLSQLTKWYDENPSYKRPIPNTDI